MTSMSTETLEKMASLEKMALLKLVTGIDVGLDGSAGVFKPEIRTILFAPLPSSESRVTLRFNYREVRYKVCKYIWCNSLH